MKRNNDNIITRTTSTAPNTATRVSTPSEQLITHVISTSSIDQQDEKEVKVESSRTNNDHDNESTITSSSTSSDDNIRRREQLLRSLWNQYRNQTKSRDEQNHQQESQQQQRLDATNTNRINDDIIKEHRNISTLDESSIDINTKKNIDSKSSTAETVNEKATKMTTPPTITKPSIIETTNPMIKLLKIIYTTSNMPNNSDRKNDENNKLDYKSLFSLSTETKERMLHDVLNYIDQQMIPSHDMKDEWKQKWIYKGTIQQLQYQRDYYLMGIKYANYRKMQRNNHQNHPLMIIDSIQSLGEHRNSLCYKQLINPIIVPFIPSITVQNALVPLIIQHVPTLIYQPIIIPQTIQLIQLQQKRLDTVIKNQLLQYLQNPNQRDAMKYSMIQATTKFHNNNTNNYHHDNDNDNAIPEEFVSLSKKLSSTTTTTTPSSLSATTKAVVSPKAEATTTSTTTKYPSSKLQPPVSRRASIRQLIQPPPPTDDDEQFNDQGYQ